MNECKIGVQAHLPTNTLASRGTLRGQSGIDECEHHATKHPRIRVGVHLGARLHVHVCVTGWWHHRVTWTRLWWRHWHEGR